MMTDRDGMRRKHSLPLAFALACLFALYACGVSESPPPDEEPKNGWTWLAGSQDEEELQPGSYGTQGQAAPTNVPGARRSSVSWTAADGTLWLFGGSGYNADGAHGSFNDMWRYGPSNRMWTWISGSNGMGEWGQYGTKGVPDASNVPGARDAAVALVDADGRFWLFGGWGACGDGNWGELNDLWRFDPATRTWIWVSGNATHGHPGIYGAQGVPDPANVPGGRQDAVAWIDIYGRIWLFGGFGYDAAGNPGTLNDLWKFDPETLEWTWVKGAKYAGQKAVFGIKGQSSPANDPGGVSGAVAWLDGGNNLWLFGGGRYNGGLQNTLWRFNPYISEWTWISGSDLRDAPGYYGTQGIASPANVPGARAGVLAWCDSPDELWIFGGYGYAESGYGHLGDLWRFDRASLEWTWVSGTSALDQSGIYGTKGQASLANRPGGRQTGATWRTSAGELWLFGGGGPVVLHNDLWRFCR